MCIRDSAYVDLRSTSQALVQNELSLIKNNNLTFVESLTKLSPKTRKSSILCKALNYKARTDEDIVSQALLSLQQASIKYFEKDRDINFSQFAIISIRKGVYDYLNKKNHTNGSDLNEKIHTAIRTIKKSRSKIDSLTNKEAKHLALHFNPVSYTHLRAHETLMNLVCRLLLEKTPTRHRQQT